MQNLPPKGSGEWELYDIVADPSELTNLVSEKPELVARLQAFYASYAAEVNLVPVPDGYNPLEQTVINAKRGGSHELDGTARMQGRCFSRVSQAWQALPSAKRTQVSFRDRIGICWADVRRSLQKSSYAQCHLTKR